MYPTISPAAAKTAALMHQSGIRATVDAGRLARQARATAAVDDTGFTKPRHTLLRPAYAALGVVMALGGALNLTHPAEHGAMPPTGEHPTTHGARAHASLR